MQMALRKMRVSRFSSYILRLVAVLCGFGMLTITVCAATQAAEVLPDDVYTNPLGPRIPDPFVFRASNGRYYAYGTTGFQAWSSPDLVHWKSEGVVFPAKSRLWGTKDFWAPEVVEYQGKFYLYYSAERASGGKRIGVAVSNSPVGPFADAGVKPLFDPGYATIDAHVFIDTDNKKYLYYAQDQFGINGRYESRIYVVELNDDMVSVRGQPVLCTKPDQPWEQLSGPGRLWNEGPTMVKHGGIYYLMYSANFYNSRNYAIGYATANSPLGPFTKSAQNPVVKAEGNHISGPGHHSVTTSPNGTELFIAYHTHVDAVAGQGARQMNIDKMGFRSDGSLYVNGPTITPQPTPAGNLNLRNIAPEAVVSTSSVQEGYRAAAVTDGEVGVYRKNERNEWAAAGEGEGAWVQLTWSEERRVGTIFIYNSAEPNRRIRTGKLVFSDGTTIDKIAFPETPGAAMIVHAPAVGIKWVRFVAAELEVPDSTAGLAEIVALDYQPGSAWLSSPQQGVVVQGSVPVMVAAPDVAMASVGIALDGRSIYEATTSPQNLLLHAHELPAGKHELTLVIGDKAGKTQRATTSFWVEHVRLLSPKLSYGEVLKGTVPLEPRANVASSNIQRASVQLVPVGGEGPPIEVWRGLAVPTTLNIDTLAVADGAYDMIISLETTAGVTSQLVYRVVVDNWYIEEDEILPPVSDSWFGADRLKAVDRSTGWEHTVVTAENFFGDAGRLRRQGQNAEYLTWDAPQLHTVTFTLYAREAELQQAVNIDIRDANGMWRSLPYSVDVVGNSPAGWLQLKLQAKVPDGVEAHFVRLTFTGTSVPADALELGHVLLSCRVE